MKSDESKHKKEDLIKYKKNMIYNAVEEGWKVEKKNGCYIFKKKHENKEEIFAEDYLEKFLIKTTK